MQELEKKPKVNTLNNYFKADESYKYVQQKFADVKSYRVNKAIKDLKKK